MNGCSANDYRSKCSHSLRALISQGSIPMPACRCPWISLPTFVCPTCARSAGLPPTRPSASPSSSRRCTTRSAKTPGVLGPPPKGRTASGITGLVYRSVRGVTRVVGDGVDTLLGMLAPLVAEQSSSQKREAVVAALNGVLGDYLVASGNPLAIEMRLRVIGAPVGVDRAALAAAFPDAGRKVVVLLHGLCMNDLQWNREGHDHGAGPRARSRLHADLPALQHRPAHRRQRPRFRETHGDAGA